MINLRNLLALLLLPTTLWAWGPEGHQAVGLIAKAYLTPDARANVEQALAGEDLGDQRVTSWADYVRGNRRMSALFPENRRWHFIEASVNTTAEQFALAADGHDVASQTVRWQRELADAQASPLTRRNAVRFLAHLVGDLHQPMHCADREGDRGGNLVPVDSFRGHYFSVVADPASNVTPNLHRTWDDYLVFESMSGVEADLTTWVQRLQGTITPEQALAWSTGTPKEWAWAAHALAVSNGYRLADGTEVPRPGSGAQLHLEVTNYVATGVRVVEEQLKKAGVRLAYLLNEATVDGRTPRTTPR